MRPACRNPLRRQGLYYGERANARVENESMANLYGGRWRTTGSRLGQGGQSEVFRVVDESEQLEGEYALKRVLNRKRHERFRTEIDAIRRLKHPNIVTLIDHSALDVSDGEVEQQYLVMPVASGGSLADQGRVSLYKDNIAQRQFEFSPVSKDQCRQARSCGSFTTLWISGSVRHHRPPSELRHRPVLQTIAQ